MSKKTIKDVNVKGKRVIVRVDFNVSLNNGKIANEKRILEALPTIRYLVGSQAKVILVSHLGRPNGKVDFKYSIAPVAKNISKHLGKNVAIIDKFWNRESINQSNKLKIGDVCLLENIRFHPGEEENDPKFARHLSKMGDVFVNDAFGTSHRAHASVVGIADHLPAFAGFLLAKEIEMISYVLNKPKKPLTMIIGGAKTPEKISLIEKFLDTADNILVGGACANTFLKAWGIDTGTSIVDHEMIEMAKVSLWKASHRHCALILPEDVIVSDSKRLKKPTLANTQKIPKDLSIFDIGPKTRKRFSQIINESGTIIWNGPVGFYEDKKFKKGTDYILNSIAKSKAFSLVGGGDTISSIDNKSLLKNISYLSTGGGALLEFLQKGTLPGIEVIKDK